MPGTDGSPETQRPSWGERLLDFFGDGFLDLLTDEAGLVILGYSGYIRFLHPDQNCF